MRFHISDYNEYIGELFLTGEDGEAEVTAYVGDAYDDEEETWDQESVREAAEQAVKEHFGADAMIIWEMI